MLTARITITQNQERNIGTILNQTLHFIWILPVFHQCPFCVPESHIYLLFIFSLDNSSVKKFFFHDLDISEKYRSLLYGISLNLVCFFLFGMRVCMPFGGKNTKEISYVLLMHQIKRFIMSKCLITGDADFHRLVKVVSPRFLRCKVTIFLFYLISRGRYFETTHILVLFKLSPTNFTTNW